MQRSGSFRTDHQHRAIASVIGVGDGQPRVAVTSIPDTKKGEPLIVVHTDLGKSADEICRELRTTGLPSLWIPSPESFCLVADLPVSATGKLDLKAIRQLALAQYKT
jgi:acyl-[acyl-carrier-protein]-phospholipid O-acyltransferase / long-chain-fatty-acid--[acyl-carrier-protein] ligase